MLPVFHNLHVAVIVLHMSCHGISDAQMIIAQASLIFSLHGGKAGSIPPRHFLFLQLTHPLPTSDFLILASPLFPRKSR